MELDDLPSLLRGSRSWGDIAGPLQGHLRRRPQDAVEAAAVLDRDLDRHGHDIAVAAVREGLFSVVCRSRDQVATGVAFRLGSAPRPTHPSIDPVRVRQLNAMELAAVRPTVEVHALLSGGEPLETDPEFGLLLLHELVLRRKELPRDASRYTDWAKRSHHPLASLPLRLLDVEAGLPEEMTMFGPIPNGSSGSLVELVPRTPVPLGALLTGLGLPLEGGDDSGVVELFDDWAAPGYGMDLQRRTHGPDFPVVPDRPSPSASTEAEVVALDVVLSAMFCAAVGGGAYGDGAGGAWSRLRLWRAVATIVGARWPCPVDELVARAASWRWIALAVDHEPWFEKVAWDFWCLADSGELVVAVAATDSD